MSSAAPSGRSEGLPLSYRLPSWGAPAWTEAERPLVAVPDPRSFARALGFDYSARETEPVRTCNLCGSEEHVEISQRDRYGFPASMRMCTRCGLGFLSPRLTPAEYEVFYRDVYRRLKGAFRGRRRRTPPGLEPYATKVVRFLRATVPEPPASVLDVGGSSGTVAAAVRDEFGAEATVLDPAEDDVRLAASAGLEAIGGLAEDFDSRGRQWDLVLLCRAIDHLLDVDGTLRAMHRMTASAGHVFVDFRDFMRPARRRRSVEEAVAIEHPYYLTYETARAFLTRAGLEPIAEFERRRFVLVKREPREPDWDALRKTAEANLHELLSLG